MYINDSVSLVFFIASFRLFVAIDAFKPGYGRDFAGYWDYTEYPVQRI